MILFFHFLCLLARYIVINISKSIRQRQELSDESDVEEAVKNLSRGFLLNIDIKPPEYQNQTLRFFPPIYVQRYETVALILKSFAEDGMVRKVVEFGCAELGLLPYLKNIESIREIFEVDLNEELLRRSAFKAAPLTTDYLISKGVKPLDIYLLAGDVTNYDDCLAGCDTVICIELIEHLSEEIFYKMSYNIFHQIKPKVAIFTTPNADFNTLFPNFEGMRHEDHKFEWTRKEFYLWTQGIISQYDEYSVRFYGVGAGPEGTENLGCCSQVAVFSRSDDLEPFSSAREKPEGFQKYKLIKHYKYPVFVDKRTIEEKVFHEIQYQMSYLNTMPIYNNSKENETAIPLGVLKEYVKDFCLSDDEFLNILKNGGLELRSDNDLWYLIVRESEVDSSDDSFEEEEWLNKDLSQCFCAEDNENLDENWDLEEETQLESTNFHTARSLEETIAFEGIKVVDEECSLAIKDKTLSAPSSSNKLSELLVIPDDSNAVKEYLQRPKKCRIPRKIIVKEADRNSVTSSVCEPFRIISKYYNLDSYIDEIDRQTDFYFIPGKHSSLRNIRSFSCRNKGLMYESSRSLFSSSTDRAADSGYDMTLEMFTDNEISRSTSPSREANVILRRPRPLRQAAVVENGDLANNNWGLKGIKVVGLMEIGKFPPWLLKLGYLAQQRLLFPLDFAHGDDKDTGEDTRSKSSQSIEAVN